MCDVPFNSEIVFEVDLFASSVILANLSDHEGSVAAQISPTSARTARRIVRWTTETLPVRNGPLSLNRGPATVHNQGSDARSDEIQPVLHLPVGGNCCECNRSEHCSFATTWSPCRGRIAGPHRNCSRCMVPGAGSSRIETDDLTDFRGAGGTLEGIGPLSRVIPGKIWIAGGLELAFIAAVVVGLRKSRGTKSCTSDDLDPLDRLQDILASVTPSRTAAKVIAAEASVLYYAFKWKPKPHIPSGTRGFSMHERSGASVLFLCAAFLSLLEIMPVHLMVNTWSPAGAWIATGLNGWSAIAIIAMSRAFVLRPTLVGSDGVVVRYGLLFRLRIPVNRIQSIETGADCPTGTRVVPRDTAASVCIRFTEPLEAEFLFGITKRISAIGLSADDGVGLTEALNQLNRQFDA